MRRADRTITALRARLAATEALMREARRCHDSECPETVYRPTRGPHDSPCDCGADEWNARLDSWLGEERT